MIRRDETNHYFLITQTAHARLAADLASAVGNEKFPAPLPRDKVLQAIQLHDQGWPLHDDTPTINPKGQPTDVFETPLETAIKIWSASTDRAAAAGPYAGLLVSLHGLALAHHVKPTPDRTRAEAFALMKFQHAQIESQESLRTKLGMRLDIPLMNGLADPGMAPDEDLLIRNFRLLEFADQMSLNLCFAAPRFATIELGTSQLRIEKKGSGVFSIEPWPFNQDVLELEIKGKRLPKRKFAGSTELQEVFNSEPESTERISVVKRR